MVGDGVWFNVELELYRALQNVCKYVFAFYIKFSDLSNTLRYINYDNFF